MSALRNCKISDLPAQTERRAVSVSIEFLLRLGTSEGLKSLINDGGTMLVEESCTYSPKRVARCSQLNGYLLKNQPSFAVDGMLLSMRRKKSASAI